LNHRLNTLLQSAHLEFLYDSSKVDKTVWDTLTSFFSPSQMRILSSYDDINIDERFLYAGNENLHSVRLYEVNQEYIDQIFQLFSNNNQVKCLYVEEKREYRKRKTLSIVDLLLDDHSHRFVSLFDLSILSSRTIDSFLIEPIIEYCYKYS